MPLRGSAFVKRLAKGGDVCHPFAVHFRDDIFALDVLRGGEAVVRHVGHDHSLLHV